MLSSLRFEPQTATAAAVAAAAAAAAAAVSWYFLVFPGIA